MTGTALDAIVNTGKPSQGRRQVGAGAYVWVNNFLFADEMKWMQVASVRSDCCDPIPAAASASAQETNHMANVWRGKGKAFQAEDFMPVKRQKQVDVEATRKSFDAGVRRFQSGSRNSDS